MNSFADRFNPRSKRASWWLSVLLPAQPVLDVLSYWMGKTAHGEWVSLGLRMLLLAVSLILAYIISNQKRFYWLTFIALSAFWIAHVGSCLRVGYESPIEDFVNYARVAQIPLLTICMITLLRHAKAPAQLIERLLTVTLYFIFTITVIAVLTGTVVYSYDKWNVGYSGWFALPNSQSAVYGVLTVFTVFAALERKDWARVGVRCLAGFLLLFFLGTRLAYAEIFLIAFAALAGMLLTRRFEIRAAGIILLLAVLCAAFYPQSPMAINRRLYQESVAEQQQTADDDNLSLETLYEKYMSAMVDRFGMDAVEEVYHQSRDVSVIGNVRLYKINYCRMVMAELPMTSKLFGFELAKTWHQNSVFDVENDYHGIYFLYGAVGLTLLIGFLMFFAVKAVLGFIHSVSDHDKMWTLSASLSAAVLIGNAAFSASVLRRPNASFYLSLTLAVIWLLERKTERRSA